jgi:MFS family permease
VDRLGNEALPRCGPAVYEERTSLVDQQPAQDGQTDAEEPDPRRWRALAVCLVGGFMTLLDVSIVNVALPSIKSGLHTPESDLQWVLSGYALAFGLVLIPAGRLGDARGRRPVFIVGLSLFTLASAACGMAQTSMWLVIARLAQGAAGGLISPQISALIQQMFKGRERGKAFGAFGTVVGISTAVGPLLGGLLIQAAGPSEGWRWVFYVNLPIGAVCVLLARRLLPDTPSAGRVGVRELDPLGVLLLGAGVFTLLLPFVEAQQWHGGEKYLLLLLAAVLLAAFVGWEARCTSRGTHPVVQLSLFKIRSFWLGSSMILLYFAGFTSIFFISTLYLQSGLHYSALLAGIAIGLGGTVLAVHMVEGRGVGWAMAAPLLFAGLGSGLVIAPNQTLTLSEVPVRMGGTAGGTLQTGQRVGSAIGIAAVGSVFFAQLRADGWRNAYDHGLIVSVAFVVAALIVALIDVITGRRGTVRGDSPAAIHESA